MILGDVVARIVMCLSGPVQVKFDEPETFGGNALLNPALVPLGTRKGGALNHLNPDYERVVFFDGCVSL